MTPTSQKVTHSATSPLVIFTLLLSMLEIASTHHTLVLLWISIQDIIIQSLSIKTATRTVVVEITMDSLDSVMIDRVSPTKTHPDSYQWKTVICSGQDSTILIDSNGDAYGCGYNTSGQLGLDERSIGRHRRKLLIQGI